MEKLYVIKIGGNVIDDEAGLSSFLKSFAGIKERKILVHGGGKMATALAEQLGIKQKMVDGRRITDKETLRVVTMVYAGYINKTIVTKLQASDCNAIGLSGPDGNLIKAHKREHAGMDYGFAGDIETINHQLIRTILEEKLTPVISAITHDQKGQLLNTNADTIAQHISVALSPFYEVNLLYLFEKPGVLMNAADESSVIPKIGPEQFKKGVQQESITAGMIPKLENAFEALDKGVKKILIGKPSDLNQLIAGTAGTTIVNNE